MSAVATHAYARSHTSVYVSDKLQNFMKVLVRAYGLDPTGVVDAWKGWVGPAARYWLETGHLESITIEFYRPGSDVALGRWDFPIRYDGNGVDEIWVDRLFFQDSLAKATPPPAGCSYRIVLFTTPGRPDVPGLTLTSTTMRSLGGLVAREAGTVISTPDIMASARYYR